MNRDWLNNFYDHCSSSNSTGVLCYISHCKYIQYDMVFVAKWKLNWQIMDEELIITAWNFKDMYKIRMNMNGCTMDLGQIVFV